MKSTNQPERLVHALDTGTLLISHFRELETTVALPSIYVVRGEIYCIYSILTFLSFGAVEIAAKDLR